MRKAIAISVALLVTTIAPLAQDEVARISGTTDRQQTAFLLGAGQAITIMNLTGSISGQPTFCPPAGYQLAPAEMERLASLALTGGHNPSIFLIAVIDGLKSQFPC